MTSASAGPDPHLLFLSALSGERDTSFRTRREAFLFSMLGQAAVMALIVYFSSCVIRNAPEITRKLPNLNALPLIFSGDSGGGGGGHDPLPASQGNLPEASLDTQI